MVVAFSGPGLVPVSRLGSFVVSRSLKITVTRVSGKWSRNGLPVVTVFVVSKSPKASWLEGT